MIIYPYPLPFVVLGVSNTGILDVENSKPVFDPDFHTELIIKDEYEDSNLGNMEKCILYFFYSFFYFLLKVNQANILR